MKNNDDIILVLLGICAIAVGVWIYFGLKGSVVSPQPDPAPITEVNAPPSIPPVEGNLNCPNGVCKG